MRKEAAENKGLTDDPTGFVKRRRVPKPAIDPVALQESAPLLGHVTPHARAYVHVACLTGMRPNAPIALTWRHVDFMRRTIAIRAGRVRKDEGRPTTQASSRDIERLEPVDDLLLRPRGETWLRGDDVCLHQERRPIDINTLRRRIWYPALKRVGLRARTLDQTRPTCATLRLATSERPEGSPDSGVTPAPTCSFSAIRSLFRTSPAGTAQPSWGLIGAGLAGRVREARRRRC